jgi:hypothetical protein
MTTTRTPATRKPSTRKAPARKAPAPKPAPAVDNGDRALNVLGWVFVMAVWCLSGIFTAWWSAWHPGDMSDAVIADVTVGAALMILIVIRMWGRR